MILQNFFLRQEPIFVPHSERITALLYIGIVAHWDLNGILVDFIGIVVDILVTEFIETIPTRADSVVHWQHNDFFVLRNTFQGMGQQANYKNEQGRAKCHIWEIVSQTTNLNPSF